MKSPPQQANLNHFRKRKNQVNVKRTLIVGTTCKKFLK